MRLVSVLRFPRTQRERSDINDGLLINKIAGDGDNSEQCKVTHLLVVRSVHRERESVSEGTVWNKQLEGDCNETGG